MPYAVFNFTASSDSDSAARPLIPGVEPGGSRAGKSKPALLIRDCRGWLANLNDTGVAAGFADARVLLKLSQDQDLDPGLTLPVMNIYTAKTATAQLWNSIQVEQAFMAQGTLWAPAFVGVRADVGAFEQVQGQIWLDYEVVDVPWMDWFIMWEWLDGIVNNTVEY